MNEKELLSQLHNLKEIKPDQEWKKSNRDILLAQISSGAGVEKKSFIEKTMNVFAWRNLEWLTEPAGVMAAIVLVVFSGTVISVKASRDTKPGDSFYIAKILGERTKQAMTFDEKEKAKLGVEFASNRAKEMAQVSSDEQKDDSKVVKLENDFKKEISAVRTRLEKITGTIAQPKPEEPKVEEEGQVFSADSRRDPQGIQVSSQIQETVEQPAEVSTSSPEMTEEEASSDPKTILDEAEKLFEQKDYEGTVSKLEEINAAIDSSDEKPMEGDATSTK